MKYTEIDLTDKVPTNSNSVIFRDNPTLEDLKFAEENYCIVMCRLQGTSEERIKKSQQIKEELGDNFISHYLYLDGRWKDEDVLSQNEYQRLVEEQVRQVDFVHFHKKVTK